MGWALPLIAAGLLCNLHPSALAGQGEPRRYHQVHMGVEVVISIHAPRDIADAAAVAAYDRITHLDSLLSDWLRHSELNRLSDSAGRGWQAVSPELHAVLRRAVEVASASEGAFDPTVGALTLLWREEYRTGKTPDPATLTRARATVDWRSIEFRPGSHQVRLLRPGTRLDLGGIAKGWILDRALETLVAHGAAAALIEAGGDLVAGNPPPGQQGWRVAVGTARGDSVVLLSRRALAVSGPSSQAIHRASGETLSHVIDPHSGEGLRTRLEATVAAPDGATADAIATALTVMDRADWPAMLARFSAELVALSHP